MKTTLTLPGRVLEETDYSRSALALRLNQQSRADYSRPILHGAQPHSAAGLYGQFKADAVVADG